MQALSSRGAMPDGLKIGLQTGDGIARYRRDDITSRTISLKAAREDTVDRRTVLKIGVAAIGSLAMPAYLRAQSNKKLSILTWNIADQEALFQEEFADFQDINPGVEIE